MPVINVNPMRPAAWGPLGRNESALRKSPAAILRRKSAVPARRGPSEG
jgi:hypothetical protein